MLLRNRNNHREQRFLAPSGDPIRKEWGQRFDEHGQVEIYQTGTTSMQEKINAGIEGTSIKDILKKYAAGDITAIHKKDGSYIDLTAMPKNIHEAHNLVKGVEARFDNLPEEIKAKFNGDYEEYMAEALDNPTGFQEKFIPPMPSVKEEIKKEELKSE